MGQTGQNFTLMQRNFTLFSNARYDTAVEYFNTSSLHKETFQESQPPEVNYARKFRPTVLGVCELC